MATTSPEIPVKKPMRRRVGVFPTHIFFDINTKFEDQIPNQVLYGGLPYTFDGIALGNDNVTQFLRFKAPNVPPTPPAVVNKYAWVCTGGVTKPTKTDKGGYCLGWDYLKVAD